jgi:hypothetical protein
MTQTDSSKPPQSAPNPAAFQADLLTLLALASLACILANVLHEAVGHGGACLLSGGHFRVLTSVDFDGTLGNRFIDAGGTLANLLAGFVAWIFLRAAPIGATRLRYFLWLSMTVNWMVGAGYFLFSGVANIGDWAEFIKGLPAPGAWRVGLTILGAGSYFLVVRLSGRKLRAFLGGATDFSERMRRARRLTLVPYFTGSAVYILAGAFNPGGWYLEAISAAAASLGGMSGLLWMRYFTLRPAPEESAFASQPAAGPSAVAGSHAMAGLPRSWAWIIVAIVITVAFISILGPGIRFPAR